MPRWFRGTTYIDDHGCQSGFLEAAESKDEDEVEAYCTSRNHQNTKTSFMLFLLFLFRRDPSAIYRSNTAGGVDERTWDLSRKRIPTTTLRLKWSAVLGPIPPRVRSPQFFSLLLFSSSVSFFLLFPLLSRGLVK